MGDEYERDWMTDEMQKGWPQVDPELRDQSGAQISGKTEGDIRESAAQGIPIERGLEGTIGIFRIPKQTEFVMEIEDGVQRIVRYDPARHGPLQDIRQMQTSPSELFNQIQQSDDREEIPASQQFSNVRKAGGSRTHWLSNDHPNPIVDQ